MMAANPFIFILVSKGEEKINRKAGNTYHKRSTKYSLILQAK